VTSCKLIRFFYKIVIKKVYSFNMTSMKRTGVIMKNEISETNSFNSLYTKNVDDKDNSYKDSYSEYNDYSPTNDDLYDVYAKDKCKNISITSVENTLSQLICEICTNSSNSSNSSTSKSIGTNHIVLSCCNHIFHVKCLLDHYNKNNDDKDDDYYLHFDESNINSQFYDEYNCIKCNTNLHYEDVFNLYSKQILSNKKFTSEYTKKLNTLKEQKKRIENEMKCLNEYIVKLQNEKKMSQVIMMKTFSLMTD